MNNYFTKEYIKECDCKEIRGLRKELKIGDWYLEIKVGIGVRVVNRLDFEDGDYFIVSSFTGYPPYQYRYRRKEVIWLPTGGQLDEEIIKICKKKKYTYFIAYSYGSEYQCDATVSNPMVFNADKEYSISCELRVNPLIAKIKLLKELLNENKTKNM